MTEICNSYKKVFLNAFLHEENMCCLLYMAHHKVVQEIVEFRMPTKPTMMVSQEVQRKILHFNFFNSKLFEHGNPYG